MVGSTGRRRRARPLISALVLGSAPLALLAAGRPGQAAAPATSSPEGCVVTAVADAVTLELRCDGVTRLERLRGVRAPRPGPPHAGGEPFAVESRRRAQQWLAGLRVELADGVARLAGEDVRLALLARGLALVEPAAAERAGLVALRYAEREARRRGLGAWSHAAWRAHQASVTEPVALATPPPPSEPPRLAARAARPGQPSWEERKAAFDAALRELERAAPPPPRRR